MFLGSTAGFTIRAENQVLCSTTLIITLSTSSSVAWQLANVTTSSVTLEPHGVKLNLLVLTIQVCRLPLLFFLFGLNLHTSQALSTVEIRIHAPPKMQQQTDFTSHMTFLENMSNATTSKSVSPETALWDKFGTHGVTRVSSQSSNKFLEMLNALKKLNYLFNKNLLN